MEDMSKCIVCSKYKLTKHMNFDLYGYTCKECLPLSATKVLNEMLKDEKPTPLSSEMEEAIMEIQNELDSEYGCPPAYPKELKKAINIIKQHIINQQKEIEKLTKGLKCNLKLGLEYADKLDAIQEVIKEGDRRVYYTNEDKYRKIKQIINKDKESTK